jgi:hypothetical protein
MVTPQVVRPGLTIGQRKEWNKIRRSGRVAVGSVRREAGYAAEDTQRGVAADRRAVLIEIGAIAENFDNDNDPDPDFDSACSCCTAKG